MFGFSCHGFQHNEWWHFTFGWTRKTKGWQVKLELIMFGRLTLGDIPWTQVEVKALDCFCKDDNFGTVWIYWSYGIPFAGVFCQVHFMDSSSPSLLKSMKSTLLLYLAVLLQDDFISFALLNCKVSHCWIVNSMLPSPHWQLVNSPLCQLPMSTFTQSMNFLILIFWKFQHFWKIIQLVSKLPWYYNNQCKTIHRLSTFWQDILEDWVSSPVERYGWNQLNVDGQSEQAPTIEPFSMDDLWMGNTFSLYYCLVANHG